MAGRIFLNYRRGDAAAEAGRLYDRLCQAFSPSQIFMDVDKLEPGADFVNVLSEQVGSCDVLLAVIGKDWITARDSENLLRLESAEDFVRIEIEAALKRDVLVIPVLVDGATMPTATKLPKGLKGLARRHAVEVSHARFGADAERLIQSVRKHLDSLPQGNAPGAPPKKARKPRTKPANTETLGREDSESALAGGSEDPLAPAIAAEPVTRIGVSEEPAPTAPPRKKSVKADWQPIAPDEPDPLESPESPVIASPSATRVHWSYLLTVAIGLFSVPIMGLAIGLMANQGARGSLFPGAWMDVGMFTLAAITILCVVLAVFFQKDIGHEGNAWLWLGWGLCAVFLFGLMSVNIGSFDALKHGSRELIGWTIAVILLVCSAFILVRRRGRWITGMELAIYWGGSALAVACVGGPLGELFGGPSYVVTGWIISCIVSALSGILLFYGLKKQ